MKQTLKSILPILLVGLFATSPEPLKADIVTKGITEENYDAEEHLNLLSFSNAGGPHSERGRMVLDSSDLELGAEGNSGRDWQAIGLQYDLLGIPKSAIIRSASISFTVDNSGAEGQSSSFTIFAESVPNAGEFDETDFGISSRRRTSASVSWSPNALPEVGDKITTPDVSSLIQEVVNQPDWQENNRLTLMIFPDAYLENPEGSLVSVREVEFEAGPGSDSATLTINFTPNAVPEPGSAILLLFSIIPVLFLRNRQNQ